MPRVRALTRTLETITEKTEGDQIIIGELLEALNSRGYGPLLIGPAVITILPTGAIPGVPSLCALMIIFVSVQIFFGRSHPWMPSKLTEMSFSREKFLSTVKKVKPYTQQIDQLIYPRYKFLIQDAFKPFIAILSILLSIAIMVLGFIPLMAMVPAIGILLLGLGLTARDGLLFLLSSFICIGSLAALPYAFNALKETLDYVTLQ